MPVILQQRYQNEQFWVPKANQVLGEIESISDHWHFTSYEPILLVEGVTQYLFPNEIRKFLYLREPTPAEPNLSRWAVKSTDQFQRIIQLQFPVVFYEDLDLTGTIDSVSGNSFASTALADSDNLISRLVQFTSASTGRTYSKIIALSSSNATDGTVIPNGVWGSEGEWGVVPEIGDTFSITRNFLMVEGIRYLKRFSTAIIPDPEAPTLEIVEGLLEDVPLPKEWERLLLAGLRYHGEVQTDRDSNASRDWLLEYEKAKKEWKIDSRTPKGENKRVKPSPWPSLGVRPTTSGSFLRSNKTTWGS